MGESEIARKRLEIDSDVKAVVSSGNFGDAVASNIEEQGFKAFLKKPYNYNLDRQCDVLKKVLNAKSR